MASEEQLAFERDLAARLAHLTGGTARMWGSPEELETVAWHLSHVWLASREPGWTSEQTASLWREAGSPLAGDADEHASVRTRLWGSDEERARAQVIQGYAVIWSQLERLPAREARIAPWLEGLLEQPAQAGKPDLLEVALFALMGFVATDPARFVELLSLERQRVGGHDRRPLHVVAAPGPSEAALTWTRRFTSFPRVVEGIQAVLAKLQLPSPG